MYLVGMNEETWIAIPGYSRYQASSHGRLRSLNYKRTGRTVILSPAISPDGYAKTVLLTDEKSYHGICGHTIVALVFLGKKMPGMEINHKNGVKTDNHVENLEYCTRSENIRHAYAHNLIVPKVGQLNGNSKLTNSQVEEIRAIALQKGRYYGRPELAKRYGVSECTIKEVVTRRRNRFYLS